MVNSLYSDRPGVAIIVKEEKPTTKDFNEEAEYITDSDGRMLLVKGKTALGLCMDASIYAPGSTSPWTSSAEAYIEHVNPVT